MKNAKKFYELLNKEGFELGCYDSNIDKLNYNNVKKILDNLCFGATDIQVSYNRIH